MEEEGRTGGVKQILSSREREPYISRQHKRKSTLCSYSALENISSISFFRLMMGRL